MDEKTIRFWNKKISNLKGAEIGRLSLKLKPPETRVPFLILAWSAYGRAELHLLVGSETKATEHAKEGVFYATQAKETEDRAFLSRKKLS